MFYLKLILKNLPYEQINDYQTGFKIESEAYGYDEVLWLLLPKVIQIIGCAVDIAETRVGTLNSAN